MIWLIEALKKYNVIPKFENGQLKLVGAVEELPSELIGRVREKKEELIAFLNSTLSQGPTIEPVTHSGPFKATNGQKRLWVLSQFEGASAVYTISSAFHITGTLQLEKLKEAFALCVQRHESLRTVFKEKDTHLYQEIKEDMPLDFKVIEVDSEEKDIHLFLEQCAKKAVQWFFDLENGPLLRIRLYRVNATSHTLVLGMHHLISDGASVQILMQDTFRYYNIHFNSKNDQITPLQVQFKEYSAWNDKQLSQKGDKDFEEFWKNEFTPIPEPLSMPTDFKRPDIKTFKGYRSRFYLDLGLLDRIQKLCNQHKTTSFNFFRATLQLLLNRYSGQDDIVVGTPVANRNHYAWQNLIGLFVNTLALRMKTNWETSFSGFLATITEHSRQAFKYENYPFDRLVEKLPLESNVSRNPLFDCMLVVQSMNWETAGLPHDLNIDYLDAWLYKDQSYSHWESPSKFDLTFNIDREREHRWFIEVEYNTALFKETTIKQLFTAYLFVIEQALEQPERPLKHFAITTPSQKEQILQNFNKPIKEIDEKSIWTLLQPSFIQNRTKTAVLCKNRMLTYQNLYDLSCILAHNLNKEIFTSDVFIGLLLGRSEVMLTSILGIIKTGKAYVPIDTGYPKSRIAYIIEDAEPACLITDNHNCHLVPDSYKGKVLLIEELIQLPSDKLCYGTDEKDLQEASAYLIYTSGSTGKPKGVNICHRNVIAFLKWADTEFAETPYQILYATTSYCFDLSVFELLLPLVQGKTVRILDSAMQIPDFLDTDIDVMINTVPSVVRNLTGDAISWQPVRALNMAGEQLPLSLAEQLDTHSIEIRNLYGPSEDTTYSTMYRLEGEYPGDIPIGKPVSDTQLYIIDKHQNLLPPGVPGEICLSGQSVAKGYVNHTALTQEKFVENPFLEKKIMYKTGDVGYWLPDGNVMFKGRNDNQSKVRGYRIEPGEIQYALEKHTTIDQAFVRIAKIGEDHRILAYVVGKEAVVKTEMESYLKTKLPAYMIPDYWIEMERMPLNNNGKIDVKQLPLPASQKNNKQEYIAPLNEVQQILQELWQEIFRKETIGITDNFFELGGHSLNVLKLRSLIESRFQKNVLFHELFRYPTIETQELLLQKTPVASKMGIPRAEERPFYPVSFSQESLWALKDFKEASLAYHMHAVFEVSGSLDTEILERAFLELIKQHEILRTVFPEKEGKPVQVVIPAKDTVFTVNHVFLTEATTVESMLARVMREQSVPFDLEKGPLLRCFVLSSREKQLISVNFHHIICDGWSVELLFKELSERYSQILTGVQKEVKKENIQYKDFTVWQQSLLENKKETDTHLLFWKTVFDTGIPVLEMPTDYNRPPVKTYRGKKYSISLPGSLSRAVHNMASGYKVSKFSILTSAVYLLLHRYSGHSDLIVGTPVAGREAKALQQIPGFFVNTVPLRVQLDTKASFEAFAMLVNRSVQEVLPHQMFPFEKLIEQINPERDTSRSPLFDIMVVYQNFEGLLSDEVRNFSEEVQMKRLDTDEGTAKYDLTFLFEEKKEEMVFSLEYNTNLYREDTIHRMVTHFLKLLENGVELPNRQMRDIPMISPEEIQFLKQCSDHTKTGYDKEATIVSMFAAAVKKYPDAVALESEGTSLTYKELDVRSSAIAHTLLTEYKVQEEDLVILHTDRSEWMLISILAVLKAGAAYVPIDPDYPADRINYIINDSGSRLLLYNIPPSKELIENQNEVVFVNMTSIQKGPETIPVQCRAKQLAYVIYTSGTTGNPKGVLVEHENVTRLIANEENLFDFNASDRWTLFHSYCFDFSVWEMYGALLNGGTLVMVPATTARNSMAFYDFLEEKKITVLNQTPTAFRSLLQHNHTKLKAQNLQIRYLIFGGEALMPQLLKDWAKAYPACKNINMYGITETTVHVTYKEITQKEIDAGKSNIGRPIPTLSCYVLDAEQKQVPVGVVGELYVGGAGVARGYHNRPLLNKERFVTLEKPEGRFYRSGDFARILPNGDLEYIGRKDEQVKIRGHRIEIAEIETALRLQNGVKDTVVIPVQNEERETELSAYIIFSDTASKNISALRNDLYTRLPSYMVPAFLIALEELPVNHNGKLDKKALPEPWSVLEKEKEIVPARDETDEKLIAIWEEVLQKHPIGIQDNFFDLGGHSLKATRIVSRIHENFEIKIDLGDFFEEPTVAHLSEYIKNRKWLDNSDPTPIEGEEEEIIF
ncbi:amino acid adenylation domain-containing protein [Ascidiimonas aurantiaca]|uniref:amino acid adenylation domain-containing protein n=1 Tax=Ascidiimonas aurantiaca TaxID=1685432 RepID=UPI0030ECD836